MFRRTYSPLPAWPGVALATVLFLAPGYRGGLCLACLAADYVVGPLVARALMHLPYTLAPFDDPATD